MLDEYQIMFVRAADVFSPGAPIDKYNLFAGRSSQVQDVLNAILLRGQHVIIYGERGVGKTSLSNVLDEVLKQVSNQGMVYSNINCDINDNFYTIWNKLLREISFKQSRQSLGFTGTTEETQVNLNNFINEKVSPEDIRMLLQNFGTRFILVIDEIDRVKDLETMSLLTDTIKTLSDHAVDVTLILVGVADSVDALIAGHRSIERSLVQVYMPRMSRKELTEILDKAFPVLGMTIDHDAKELIVKLSEGLPHYTHLLGLLSAQDAAANQSKHISMQNVENAIKMSVKKAQHSILNDYHVATNSPRKDTLYDKVLLACALTQPDELGYFAAADIRDHLSKIMGKRYEIPAFAKHLKVFCEQERGPVLQVTGPSRRQRYRFVNPMLQPFIIMNGLDKGLISEDAL